MYKLIPSPIQRIQQKLLSHNIDQHENILVGCQWPAHQPYGGRAKPGPVPEGCEDCTAVRSKLNKFEHVHGVGSLFVRSNTSWVMVIWDSHRTE